VHPKSLDFEDFFFPPLKSPYLDNRLSLSRQNIVGFFKSFLLSSLSFRQIFWLIPLVGMITTSVVATPQNCRKNTNVVQLFCGFLNNRRVLVL